jgi:hypothetical protein
MEKDIQAEINRSFSLALADRKPTLEDASGYLYA